MPIGRRSCTEISTVDGSTRRIVALSTHGDASSFCCHSSRLTARMFWPRRPSTSASTSPVDNRSWPRTTMWPICSDDAAAISVTPRYAA